MDKLIKIMEDIITFILGGKTKKKGRRIKTKKKRSLRK